MGASIITLTTDFGASSPYAAQMKGVIYSINLLTNITTDLLPRDCEPQRWVVRCRGMVIEGLCRTYGDAPPGTIVALIDSCDRLEIAVARGNAASRLSARPGDEVELCW
jgi:S-adenosylmethionine hydrolase